MWRSGSTSVLNCTSSSKCSIKICSLFHHITWYSLRSSLNDSVNTHTNSQMKRKCQQYRIDTMSVTSRIYSEYSSLWKASSMRPAILACISGIVRVHISYSKFLLLFDTTNVFLLWNTIKCQMIKFCCIHRVKKMFRGKRFLGCFYCCHCSLIVGIQPYYYLAIM